jgi:hypothetical protein
MGGYGGRSVELVGADVLLKKVQTLSNDMISVGGTQTSLRRMANRDLREAARLTAEKSAEAIATGRYARGAPQARKVARTARAKRDRLPVVKIPSVRVGLSGQSGRGSSGRKVKYRNRAGSGSREDRRIAWAATGGSPGNPHFPGSTNWIRSFRKDGKEFGVEEYTAAVKAILKDYGLLK